MVALAKASFDRLRAAGVSERMAYIDCVHELKYLADLIQARGIEGMYDAISDTAEFGARLAEPRLVAAMGTEFDTLLSDIRSGEFARVWNAEHADGAPRMARWREAGQAEAIEMTGRELRDRLKKRI